jgi:hypothetical protein
LFFRSQQEHLFARTLFHQYLFNLMRLIAQSMPQLFIQVCCLLSAVCCLLSAVCCLLSAACCLLAAVYWLLAAVYCLLSAVC